MSSLVWTPDPEVHRRAVGIGSNDLRVFSDDDKGRGSPRKQPRFNRFSKITWSREQVFLALVFVSALMFGYVASTLLWQLEGLGTDNLSPAHQKAKKPQVDSKKYMDKIDAKAKKGLFANAPQDPPYTRSKYLEYFRSIHYGEAALQRHGGNRRVDIQMARELSLLYARNSAGRSTGNQRVEDDLWTEVRFEGSPAVNHVQRDLEHEQVLWEKLDALIRRELEYDPNSLSQGIYAQQRSSMAFKQEVPESLSITSRDRMCPALEKSLGPPIDSRRRILFILGAQKSGTTYLFNALTKHPAFKGADHAFGQRRGPWAKEVHFFNRWPLQKTAKMDYISCFPANTWKLPNGPQSPHYTLVDATPDYMFNSMAAPRIKAMWPNAKFIVLLRDPIARAYSAWKMSKKMACRDQAKQHPTEPCVYPVFAEMVLAEAALLEKQGCAFNRKGQMYPKAWDDCYHCKFTFANETVCRNLLKWDKQPCHAPPFLTLSVSMYAAQLSWWFAHVPQANFMFITSDELRKGDPIAPLNKVVEFIDMPIPNFRQDMLKNVWGYNGGYNRTELTPLDLHAVRFLDLFFRQSNLDLAELLKDDASFVSIPPEIHVPLGSLQSDES